jgi:hypothetical protein
MFLPGLDRLETAKGPVCIFQSVLPGSDPETRWRSQEVSYRRLCCGEGLPLAGRRKESKGILYPPGPAELVSIRILSEEDPANSEEDVRIIRKVPYRIEGGSQREDPL